MSLISKGVKKRLEDDGLASDEHGFSQGPEGDDGGAKVRLQR